MTNYDQLKNDTNEARAILAGMKKKMDHLIGGPRDVKAVDYSKVKDKINQLDDPLLYAKVSKLADDIRDQEIIVRFYVRELDKIEVEIEKMAANSDSSIDIKFFYEHYIKGFSVSKCAKKLGYTRESMYRVKKNLDKRITLRKEDTKKIQNS